MPDKVSCPIEVGSGFCNKNCYPERQKLDFDLQKRERKKKTVNLYRAIKTLETE